MASEELPFLFALKEMLDNDGSQHNPTNEIFMKYNTIRSKK